MTFFALILILTSASLHAFWNLATKRINGGVEAVWLFTSVSALVFAPITLVVCVIARPHIGPIQLLFLAGSGVLQLIYFVTLTKGYQVADLSVIYPLARGTGPLIATALAIIFLGERPSAITIAGAVIICLGVFFIASGGKVAGSRISLAALGFGIGTGLVIGCYTAWDGHAVSALAIPAILQTWSADAARAVYLSPIARRNRPRVLDLWKNHRRDILTVGILSTVSYMLVLTAMSFTSVSSIAPAREVSILFGTVMGIYILKEPIQRSRIIGASVIVVGVVAVVLG